MCVFLRWPFGGNFSPHLVGGGRLPATRNMSTTIEGKRISTYAAIKNPADPGKIVIMNNSHVALRRPLCSPSYQMLPPHFDHHDSLQQYIQIGNEGGPGPWGA